MALILIVDDDDHVRAGLENLLASASHATRSFPSGEALLAAAPWPAGHCLLLDVRLQGMSGLELQQALIAARVTLPIIFLSAHCDEDTRRRALEAGAHAFFSKPFDDEALLATIDAIVDSADAG